MKTSALLLFSVFLTTYTLAQPLSDGMGIITHWTGAGGEWNAFSIYDTQNNQQLLWD